MLLLHRFPARNSHHGCATKPHCQLGLCIPPWTTGDAPLTNQELSEVAATADGKTLHCTHIPSPLYPPRTRNHILKSLCRTPDLKPLKSHSTGYAATYESEEEEKKHRSINQDTRRAWIRRAPCERTRVPSTPKRSPRRGNGSEGDAEQGMESEGGTPRVIAQPRVGPLAVDATPQIDGRSPPDTPAFQGIIFSGTTGGRPARPVRSRRLPVGARRRSPVAGPGVRHSSPLVI